MWLVKLSQQWVSALIEAGTAPPLRTSRSAVSTVRRHTPELSHHWSALLSEAQQHADIGVP
jgi:hypothetical protein